MSGTSIRHASVSRNSILLSEVIELLRCRLAVSVPARNQRQGTATDPLPRHRLRGNTSCQCQYCRSTCSSSSRTPYSLTLAEASSSLSRRARPRSALNRPSNVIQEAAPIRRYASLAYAIASTEDEWDSTPVHPTRSQSESSLDAKKDRTPWTTPLASSSENGQVLFSDEIYGEGGLVEQASWFSDRLSLPSAIVPSTSTWDYSLKNKRRASSALTSRRTIISGSDQALGITKPKLCERTAQRSRTQAHIPHRARSSLSRMLAGPVETGSAMQTHLEALRLLNCSGSVSEHGRVTVGTHAFRDLYRAVEAANLQKWQQLAEHLASALKRWKQTSKDFFTLDWRICYALVQVKIGRVDKAINLASEMIREQLSDADRAELLPFLATLAQHCVRDDKSSYLIKMIAANFEIFLPCFPARTRDSIQMLPEHRSLRDALAVAFREIKDVDAWVARQHADHIDDIGASILVNRRMSRIAIAAITTLVSVSSTGLAVVYHNAFARCGIETSVEASSLLWKALIEKGSVGQAWDVFCTTKVTEMLEVPGARLSREVLSRTLDLAHHRGDLPLAQITFDLLTTGNDKPSKRELDIFLRIQANAGKLANVNTILQCYFGDSLRRLDQDVTISPRPELDRAPLPEDISINQILVRAHAVAGTVPEAELWWDRLRARCDSPRCEDYNAMVHLYSRRGDLLKCQSLLEDMARLKVAPNIMTYTTMLGAYASSKDYRAASAMLNRMRSENLTLDHIAIGSILNVAIEAGKWTKVKEIYDTLDYGARSDPAIAGTMLKAMLLLGAPFDTVKQLFQETFPDAKSASSRAWSILIQSACDAGLLQEAHSAVDTMLMNANNHNGPNPYAFTILVAAHLRKGDLASTRRIFARMDELGVPMTSVAYSLMLKMLLKDATIDKDSVHRFAVELLTSRPWQHVNNHGRGRDSENILTPVILEAARTGNTDRVEDYTRKLAHRGELPPLTMSTVLMDAYRKAGQVEKMRRVWEHIHRLARQTRQSDEPCGASNLLCIPLSIYIDGLSTACLHQEVFDVWQSLAADGFGFDAQNWNHLAVAYVRSGQPEQAFEIVENVLLARADEVANRRSPAMREGLKTACNPNSIESSGSGAPAVLAGSFEEEAAMRPPNRRHQNRSRSDQGDSRLPIRDAIADIVSNWRPSDLTWRPTFLTVAVLERAYAQLESNTPVMALFASEEEENEMHSTAVADETERSTPLVMLARMNHRYARTISLIMLHRRKRRTRMIKKSKKAAQDQSK